MNRAYPYRYPPFLVLTCGYSPLALPLGELSPQVTERVLQPFLNHKINSCTHATKIHVDIPVGESQNLQAKTRQELRTFSIISKPLGFIMLRSIHFNDQSGRSAVKVYNESADNPLFVNLHRIFAQKRYQSLRSCGVISLRSRRAFSNWVLSLGTVNVYPLRPRCARPPLPRGEARGARMNLLYTIQRTGTADYTAVPVNCLIPPAALQRRGKSLIDRPDRHRRHGRRWW